MGSKFAERWSAKAIIAGTTASPPMVVVSRNPPLVVHVHRTGGFRDVRGREFLDPCLLNPPYDRAHHPPTMAPRKVSPKYFAERLPSSISSERLISCRGAFHIMFLAFAHEFRAA